MSQVGLANFPFTMIEMRRKAAFAEPSRRARPLAADNHVPPLAAAAMD
jgi:hypothetical protein